MIIDCGIRYEAQGRYNKNSGHEILSEALWSHSFDLVYRQEVVLPVKVNLVAYRLAKIKSYLILCVMI